MRKTQTETAKWKRFEQFVESLYRSLGYSTQPNVRDDGQQTDLLAEQFVRGIGPVRIIIECKYLTDRKVSNQDVFDFIAYIKAVADRKAVSRGILVTNSQFTADARAAASREPLVSLKNSRELEDELFDLSHAFASTITDYEASEIASHFIQLHGHSAEEEVPDVVSELNKLLNSERNSLVWLLGDFGSGKTTVMQRLNYVFASQWLEDFDALVPVLVELKDFHEHRNIESLLRHSIRRCFKRDVDISLFWGALKRGRFVVLLDGFDEIASHSDTHRRADLLHELSSVFGWGSPVVISCRTPYFVSNEDFLAANVRYRNKIRGIERSHTSQSWATQVPFRSREERRTDIEEALRDGMLGGIGATKDGVCDEIFQLFLEPLTPDQVFEYVRSHEVHLREQCQCTPAEVSTFLEEIYDLRDLMKRPIILRMIVDSILLGMINIKQDTNEFGPSALYETWTWLKFEVDWAKGSSRQLLTREQRRAFAQAVAIAMYNEGKLEITFEELSHVLQTLADESGLRDVFRKGTVEEITTDIHTCTFLSWSDSSTFCFSHKSFMEFFVARHLKECIENGRMPGQLSTNLPKEIRYFLGAFGISEPAFGGVLRRRFESVAYGIIRTNLFGSLLYSTREHLKLVASGESLNNQDITRCGFSKCNLKGVSFERVTINKVSHLDGVAQIDMNECEASSWSFDSCNLKLAFRDSNISSLNVSDCTASLFFDAGTQASSLTIGETVAEIGVQCVVTDFAFEGGELILNTGNGRVEDFRIGYCQFRLDKVARFVNGKLEGLEIGIGESQRLSVDSATLTNCSVQIHDNAIANFSHSKIEQCSLFKTDRSSSSFKNCSYIDCKFLGVHLEQEELDSSEKCRGVVFVPGKHGAKLVNGVWAVAKEAIDRSILRTVESVLVHPMVDLDELDERLSQATREYEERKSQQMAHDPEAFEDATNDQVD